MSLLSAWDIRNGSKLLDHFVKAEKVTVKLSCGKRTTVLKRLRAVIESWLQFEG
jgi:hypothetical protein